MDRRRSRLAVVFALLLGTGLALADQGIPVYTSITPQPTIGVTACTPNGRVWFDAESGGTLRALCCQSGLWQLCSATSVGTGGSLQAANGSGGFQAYTGATSCSNQAVIGFSATGTTTCASIADSYITGMSSTKLSFADSTTTNIGKATPSGVTLNVGHNGTSALATTFNIGSHVHSAAAGSGGQIDYTNLTNKPALSSISGTLGASQLFDDATAGKVLISGGAGDPSYTSKLSVGSSSTLSSQPLELAAVGTATSGTQMYDSQSVIFTTSYWTGSVANYTQAYINYDVVTAGASPTSKMSFNFGTPFVEKLSITDAGVVTAASTISAPGFKLSTVGTVANCDSAANEGLIVILRTASAPDQMKVCLRNANGSSWGWSTFAIAVQ